MTGKVGQPLKFKTPKELEEVVTAYFDNTPFQHWSVTGLALLVGSKQLLADYEKREGYSEIVTRARLMVENSYEIGLRENGGAANIFALKNFGWVDKQERELSNPKDRPLEIKVTKEEDAKLLEEL